MNSLQKYNLTANYSFLDLDLNKTTFSILSVPLAALWIFQWWIKLINTFRIKVGQILVLTWSYSHSDCVQASVSVRLWLKSSASILVHRFVHSLDLVLTPSPQVTEQSDQSLHSANSGPNKHLKKRSSMPQILWFYANTHFDILLEYSMYSLVLGLAKYFRLAPNADYSLLFAAVQHLIRQSQNEMSAS